VLDVNPYRCLSRFLVLAVFVVSTQAAAVSAAEWTAKVDPWVLDRVAAEGEAEFLVVFKEQADLSAAPTIRSKAERGRFVFERLSQLAERSQREVRYELATRGIDFRPYWIVNMIWVRSDLAAVQALAGRDDVARLSANPSVPFERPQASEAPDGGSETPEGSLIRVGAPDLWALGFTGQGAVVAGADTGYDWDHPALINQYRGWDGATAVHDYNWHDAIHVTGSDCGADSPEPCDDNGHGTHTMGTMVGDDGGSNQIGMAPGARWIGCRNMNEGDGSPATYSECFQFFIAPTDANDQNPRPDLAPDVVNGSWSCPPSEGCTDPNVILTVVENTRAAGIVVSHAASNTGPSCGTVNTPAAIYEASFSVGAVDASDNIASFSARGPVTVDGSNRLKPDVSAPGTGIRSSFPNGGYGTLQGTSMAAPHVSGLVALLISAQGCLQGDPESLEQFIIASAVPRTTTQECGGIPGSEVPNNTYGYGSIRAVVPPIDACNGLIFSDGFESGDTGNWSEDVPNPR
jgi:subtilisin family serine protease